ncbi:MAG: ABC transporter permease [Sulfolobales archaeon]
MLRPLRAVFKKEFLELVRDYRTLLMLIFMPVISMPLIGFMMISFQQLGVPSIEIVILDHSHGTLGNNTYNVSWLTDFMRSFLEGRGARVYINTSVNKPIDLMLIIPDKFLENLTSLNRQAILEMYQVPGSSNANKALNEIYSMIQELSNYFSDLKIKYISDLAGVREINIQAIKNPVTILSVGYIAPSGVEISPLEAWRIFIARMLAFSLIFVATPATTYVIDSILGEKERKTLEILLSTPIKRSHMILGKLFASSLVGLIAAIMDVIAVIIFFMILSQSLGGATLILGVDLLVVTGLVVYLIVLSTLSLSLPIIVRSSTIRTAQIASSIITILSSLIYLSTLFLDYYSLPRNFLYLLLLVPYTASIIAIQMYSFGDLLASTIALLIMIIFSAILILISTYIIDEEKMLMKPI